MKDLKLSLQLLLQKLNKLVVANENLLNKQFVFAEKSSSDYESELRADQSKTRSC